MQRKCVVLSAIDQAAKSTAALRQHLSINLTHPQNVLKIADNLNMSDDLVKRLRERSHQYVDNEFNFDKRAADRIEKLEAALREIDIACDYSGSEYVCRDIARKALEGKDD